jgi:hypothetical protein
MAVQSTLLGLFLLCAIAVGQPVTPSPAEATESKIVSDLLASQEPSQLAWGAYLTGNYRLPAFSGDLLRLATASDWRVRTAATESLIRLNVEVPEDILTKMAENRLDEVLIFIARRPEQYGRLIEQLLARKLEDPFWAVLNSILAAKPPAGFAGTLLQAWTIGMTIRVYDPKSDFVGGGGGSSMVEDGFSFAQPGFPPLAAYYVVENPEPGDVLLTKGPHPVGYRKQSGHTRSIREVNRDDYRRDYLLFLAGISTSEATSMSQQWTSASVEWKVDVAYRAAAREILRKTSQSVEYLKKRLMERKFLTTAEAERINPTLQVRVVDHRERRMPPLPDVDWALPKPGEQR